MIGSGGYASRVPSLFRRKSTDLVVDQIDASATPEPDEPVVVRRYTPKKGEATPKRPPANARRAEAPPANRKEALARSRAKAAQDRTERREGMMAGDERYLLPRDKGAARGLVRDIVDSRMNLASYFFVVLFVVLIGSNTKMPVSVQYGANLLFVFAVLATAVDSFLLSRKIRKLVAERVPNSKESSGRLLGYAIMRSISFRRMRVPRPRVKVGDKI